SCMDVESFLSGVYKDKFIQSKERNPDLIKFATEENPEKRLKTRFAPLVSVYVERSFSQYKHILTERRHNLLFDNIEIYNIVAFNSFLFTSSEWLFVF